MEPSRPVQDPESLRAVAHPLRLRLLGRLRAEGPATASALGRALGESSGATSYHLRQLERYGFVEPDPRQPSRREKVWRAVHRTTDFHWWDGAGPEERAAFDAVVEVQLQSLVAGVRRRQSEDDPDWRESHASSDLLLRLTPAALAELVRRVEALAEELQSPDDPAARPVVLHLQSYRYDGGAP